MTVSQSIAEVPATNTEVSGPAQTKPRPAKAERSLGRTILVWALASLSFLCVWMLVYALFLTPFEQSRAQQISYGKLRESLALQTTPIGGVIAPGTPVALLTSPSLGLNDVVVAEGTASGDLMTGPGHRRDTALPGQPGVSVIYGRAALFGGPFGAIDKAKAGDLIIVTTGQGAFTYQVSGVRRPGNPIPPALANGASRMTFASADGSGALGKWSPSGVVYVDAVLKGDVQQYPPGRPTSVPLAETAMQGDSSAILKLAVLLPLLILAVCYFVAMRRVWGVWQAWLTGIPMILAALWLVSEAAVPLLPNLL